MNFIAAQRTGLEALRNNADVSFIYGPVGQAGTTPSGTQVPRNWLDDLIQDGVIRSVDVNGQPINLLDIGGTLGGNANYSPLTGHDDHYHVRIDN